MKRAWFARRDLFLLGGLLLAAALLFLLLGRSPAGTVAVLEQNGEVQLRQELTRLTEEKTLTVEGLDGLQVELVLSSGGARFTRADCPDQVCVRTGKITRAGESILCLPAGVTLRLEGAGGVDAETY